MSKFSKDSTLNDTTNTGQYTISDYFCLNSGFEVHNILFKEIFHSGRIKVAIYGKNNRNTTPGRSQRSFSVYLYTDDELWIAMIKCRKMSITPIIAGGNGPEDNTKGKYERSWIKRMFYVWDQIYTLIYQRNTHVYIYAPFNIWRGQFDKHSLLYPKRIFHNGLYKIVKWKSRNFVQYIFQYKPLVYFTTCLKVLKQYIEGPIIISFNQHYTI